MFLELFNLSNLHLCVFNYNILELRCVQSIECISFTKAVVSWNVLGMQ